MLNSASAQTQPPPAVEWKDIMAPPMRPGWGLNYTWNQDIPATYAVSTVDSMVSQTPDESGEDWWYAHCNLYDPVTHAQIGYAAAGYSSATNWGFDDAGQCFHGTIGPEFLNGNWSDSRQRPDELETRGRRKGGFLTFVARYDLNGHMIWCRRYMPGVYWDVEQASDGSIVVVGEASANRYNNALGANQTVGYRPVGGVATNIAGVDRTQLDVMKTKMILSRIALDGTLMQHDLYANAPDHVTGWPLTAVGKALSRITVNGQPGLYVVGFGDDPQVAGTHPMAWRLLENGSVVDDHIFLPTDPARLLLNAPTSFTEWKTFGLGMIAINGVQSVAISGFLRADLAQDEQRAFLWYFPNIDLQPYGTSFVQHTASPQLAAAHTAPLQFSTEAVLMNAGGQPAIIWPVLSNYSQGTDYFAGRSIADLRVYRFDPPQASPTWAVDLGEMRAYDLQCGATVAADGNIALVSTKRENPTLTFADLPQAVRDCLLDPAHLGYQYALDPQDANPRYWWTSNLPNGEPETKVYDYWQTDAYVAKLNAATGATMWETIFDADPDVPAGCFPEDMRKQECVYRIVQADDGGLVISGNTSRNFDDTYLVKLRPDCQSHVVYDFTMDPDHVYTVSTTEVWVGDKNIAGTILIPQGHTLTISNCTIRFADSQQIAWPTRIIVENGGSLIVDNAILTSLDQCPNSMWDGIQLRGQELASQLPYPGIGMLQGYLSAKNSTIRNARTAVALTDGDFLAPLPPKPGSGGILEATDCVFLNNKYDVAFSPYENHSVANPQTILPNRSFFTRCDFVTDGGLPVQGQFPNTHVVMTSVRGITFKGCTWRNTLFGQAPLELASQQGTGINSINSSFIVSDDCNVVIPNYCPPQNLTTSAFSNLHRGILATTFDPSRTFSVDNATFTGTNYGIRMEGIQDASITRCTFDVPEPFTPGIVGSTYGVYSDECTGYRIQENAFLTQQPEGDVKKVGLIIKDSGKQYNTFYNNSFENLYTGSIIQGNNADANEELGLEVKCNDYGLVDQNTFDVALTGGTVRVQKTQGAPFDPLNAESIRNPAGNRFSVDHEPTPPDPEADWHVQVGSTVTEYFNHTPTFGNRTYPDFEDELYLIGNPQLIQWPGKQSACPSQLNSGTKEEKRLLAEGEHGEYEDGKEAYDATKDNGATYSLLGYVSDPTKSSTQVRNALQSVAPKVSAEVWKAAFERSPAMSAWNITQALLSNSPLQSEVLRMVDEYALPSGYAPLVHGAQTGEVNILTQLASAMAKHGGNKAEALADLGRLSWLDSLDLSASLDSLRLFHEALPADNHALAVGGVLAAQGAYSALAALAQAEESASTHPERYALLKHYAQLEQQQGWSAADAAVRTWLSDLGQQRDVLGSAWANAWLHALGNELPEEVIVLPEIGPKSMGRSRTTQPVQWAEEQVLEVFPNPAKQVAFVVFEQAGESNGGELRILDLNGRAIASQRFAGEQSLVRLNLAGLSSGIYLLDLRLEGQPSAQTKLVVQ